MALGSATQKQMQDLQGIAQAAPPQDWKRIRIPLLDGGMRTDKDGQDLQPNESPFIQNLALIGNKLIVDTGYVELGTFTNGATFIGTPQLFYQVFNPDGTAAELLITTATVYQLVLSTNLWELMPANAFYTSTAPVSTGGSSINLTSATGLAINDYLGLPMDNGQQLQVKITNIVGTAISFNPAVPAGRSVPISSSIVHAYNLAGSLDNQIAATAFAGKNWTIFSNSTDPLFYYDGAFIKSLVTGSDLPVGTSAIWLTTFHESLILAGTLENGQEFPQRVRVSDIGNPQSFKPASAGGPLTSIAAIYDLVDTEDFIHSAAILGPYLILYRETTIMRATYLGVLNNLLLWEYMAYGEGVRSQGAVNELGSTHEIVGNGGIYSYEADYSLTSEGDAIFINFLSAVGDLNPATQSTLFCQYQQDYDETWTFYPANGSTLPNKMLRHSLERSGWYTRVFANQFVSANPYLILQSTIWGTATGTWASQTTQWDSRIFLANVAALVMCAPDTNKVYVYDYKSRNDAGTTIAWAVQTKDIGEGNSLSRWDQVRISGQGTIDSVQFSVDQGQTWNPLGSLTLSLGTPGYLTFQTVSAYIRFQLTGTDSNFQLNWLEAWYQEESEY